jgi:hypothetical protein
MRDLLHKCHIRLMEHDVEVFDGVDGLERLPVPEPDDLLRRHSRTKRGLHVSLDRLSRRCCQIARGGVIGKLEFGPDNQVDDIRIDPVRPVIVQNPNVLCIRRIPRIPR